MENGTQAGSDQGRIPKKIILYPFIFAVFPVFALFNANVGQVFPEALILALLVVLVVTALFLALFSFLLGSQETGALVTLWCVLFVFLYGSFSELIMKFKFGDFVLNRNMHRIPVYTVSFLLFGYGLIKLYKRHPQLTRWLKVLSSWLMFIMAMSLAWAYVSLAGHHSIRSATLKAPSRQSESLPDIYYIILDGYGGSETLSNFFGYDNLPFINYLQTNGFYFPKQARSNYAMTVLSLASSLGMDYWQKGHSVQAPANQVRPFLEQHGYDYIGISSMDPPARNRFEHGYSPRGLLYNAFMLQLTRTTVLDAVAQRFKFYSENVRENVLYSFEQLKKIPNLTGNKFVFAHIVSPHPPYVFKANGDRSTTLSDISLSVDKTPWDDKGGYVEQLRFINSQAREAISTILQKSRIPPIIILQGDHGPHLTAPDQRTASELRMHILNAYHLPGGGDSVLYDTITPVNSFRAVFNYYFRAGMPMLEDKCYFSNFIRPFRFFDVTAETASEPPQNPLY